MLGDLKEWVSMGKIEVMKEVSYRERRLASICIVGGSEFSVLVFRCSGLGNIFSLARSLALIFSIYFSIKNNTNIISSL